jgi:nicotinamide-nucleotide amidase
MPAGGLAKDVIESLKARGWKLAVAESMTGGLLGAALTTVPGSADVFLGGVISYVDAVKVEHLGVDRGVLERKGAVSAEVARAMAEGARGRFGADVAVSVTGFAGPNVPPGGEAGKVHLGLATKSRATSKEMHFGGDREAVRKQAVEEALRMVLDEARRS